MTIRTRLNLDVPDAELDALVCEHRFGRYCEDASLPLDAARRHVGQLAKRFLGSTDATCIEATGTSGRTLGVLLVKLSSWDTQHFGYPCAILDSVLIGEQRYGERRRIADALLTALRAWLHARAVQFTTARIAARDLPVIHSLGEHGFDFIENWVFTSRPTSATTRLDVPPYPLRPAGPADAPIMLEYAKDAFDTQRFHADPHIERTQADAVYEHWITTSFRDPRMKTLVYEEQDHPVAYMTYYDGDLVECFGLRFAIWKMALIDPEMRGQGVGTRFFRSLVQHHHTEGFDVVDSGLSLRNVASLHIHNKCDFKVTSTMLTLHLWSHASE